MKSGRRKEEGEGSLGEEGEIGGDWGRGEEGERGEGASPAARRWRAHDVTDEATIRQTAANHTPPKGCRDESGER